MFGPSLGRCLRPPCSGSASRSFPRAASPFTTATAAPARQALGRITPRRIAVQMPPGSGGGSIPRPSIWTPIAFCVLLGGGGYLFAAAYTEADTQRWSQKLGKGSIWRTALTQPTDREIARAKQMEGAAQAQKIVNGLSKELSWIPRPLLTPMMRGYVLYQEWKLNSPPAQTVQAGIIGGFGLVFLGWKMRRLEPFMRKWWLHRPVVFGGKLKEWQQSITLFTSTLSHQTLAHIGFNSFALYGFGAAAYACLASPPPPNPNDPSSNTRLITSTHTPHYLAFLLLAGLTSSLGSHLYTNLVRLPRLIRTLTSPARLSSPQALAAHEAILPSLGASGAIWATLTATACAFPDTQIGIILIPFVSFPISYGVGGMVLFDIIGLARGWRVFDHVAHLCGAAFGFLYYRYGRDLWWKLRRTLHEERLEAEARRP